MTVFVVGPQCLRSRTICIAWVEMYLQMLAHDLLLKDGWRVGYQVVNDQGVLRHRFLPMRADG